MIDEKELDNFRLLDSVLHAVLITDPSGKVVYLNHAASHLLGKEPESHLGVCYTTIFCNHLPTPEILLRDKTDIRPFESVWTFQDEKGANQLVNVRVTKMKPVYTSHNLFMITLVEKSAYQKPEEQPGKNLILYQSIINSGSDAIVTVNKEGEIKTANQSILSMFGYQVEEVIGCNVKMLLPLPFTAETSGFPDFESDSESKRSSYSDGEIQGIRKDGSLFPIELTVNEIDLEGERLYVGVIRDQSRRRELQRIFLESGIEERRKIGRELHDGLGQMLTGIRMLSENLARKLAANALPGSEEVKELARMVSEADECARTLARGMIYVDVEKRGLSVALQNLCDQTERTSGVKCRFLEGCNTEFENHTMALHIYRIVQESVSNALKHGKPNEIKVRLSKNLFHTSVTIDDDGTGIPEDFDIEEEPGMGLKIMKFRAGIMGGLLEITRTGDQLTRVRCIVPNEVGQSSEVAGESSKIKRYQEYEQSI